jgi:hypothetical protein
MISWAQEIEDDLKWREAEMASLKILSASTKHGSDRQRALLRAIWAMLYAHYEGFCKFCWDLLLTEIEKTLINRNDLREEIAILSLRRVFKNLRANSSDQQMWDFFTTQFAEELTRPAAFPFRLETQSNLWVNVAEENNAAVGLKCSSFARYKNEINRIVSQRNEIAHGKKLVISDLHFYQPFEDAAFLVMHDLAVAVVDCLEQKNFLGYANASAVLI